MLDDIIKERLRKLKELRDSGHDPYPARVKRTITTEEAVRNFSKLLRSKQKVFLVGRIMGLRDQGNLIFVDLADEFGKIQCIFKKDTLTNFLILKRAIDIGDFLEVRGSPFITKKGEKSIEASEARVAAKSIRPLPSEWYGLKDVEERYRKRYLDTILNSETRTKFEARSKIIRELREFLHSEGFIEVETPVLQELAGGAKAKPFVTHHNALDQDFYLRIAPELFLKRLLVGGFEKIFEIGRVFRNEGIDHDHNPEFTMMELYWAYADWEELMKFTEKMLKPILKKRFGAKKWPHITYEAAAEKYAGNRSAKLVPEKLDDIFKHEVRPKIIEPTFVTHYPKSISPLAKSDPKNPELTERFQLIVGGTELVNGFSELNDPAEQRTRMEEQERRFRAGDEEEARMDHDFLEALEYGMPPAAGLGIGIDRLAAIATLSHNVKEVIIFPTLRSRS